VSQASYVRFVVLRRSAGESRRRRYFVEGCGRRLSVMLEDPGRFYWKWLATGAGLLIVYAIERSFRTGGLF